MWELVKLVWRDAVFLLGIVAGVGNAWATAGEAPIWISIAGTVAAGTVVGVQAARKFSSS